MDTAEPEFLSHATVAIIGLGLMGGSLAMALRSKCAQILGVDSNPETLDLALHTGVVDLASSHPEELLPGANVIILATPVGDILKILDALPRLHPGAAVVMDLGSTKQEICAKMQRLPARFEPIGGHPMCGKEKLSLANADPRLFQDAAFALAACPNTAPRARQCALEVVRAVNARPLWVDPLMHDEWVAATSHLPYLLACALALATPAAAAPLAGSGYRSAARLAATPTHMMNDILATNTKNILQALHLLQTQINQIETLLSSDNLTDLETVLVQAGHHHQQIIERGKTS